MVDSYKEKGKAEQDFGLCVVVPSILFMGTEKLLEFMMPTCLYQRVNNQGSHRLAALTMYFAPPIDNHPF